MKEHARLTVSGYFGSPFPPALSFNLTAAKLWKRGDKTVKTLKGVVRLDAEGGSGPAARYAGEITGAALIRLSHRRLFLDDVNGAAHWSDVGGGGALKDLHSNAFGNGVAALWSSDGSGSTASHYVSTNFDMADSRAFCVNGYIYRSEDSHGQYVWQLRSGRFIFQIRDGRAEAMWTADSYTQAQEDTLWGLLAIAEPDAGQQSAIETAKVALYDTAMELDLGGSEYFVNNAFTLDFMPEPGAARVGVEAGNGKRATLTLVRPDSERGTRVDLWTEGRLHVRATGGAYFWQVGNPDFGLTGEVVIQEKSPVTPDQLGTLDWTLNRDLPPGTAATIEQRTGDGAYDLPLAVVLTSDGRSSPTIYGAAVYFEGGERSGIDEVVWDSDNHLIGGCAPIIDCKPTWDENGRIAWDVELALLGGHMLSDLPGFNYPYMEDRLATLTIGDVVCITNGIVTDARISNLRQMTPNLPETLVEAADTSLVITISDLNAICAETKLLLPPVGDALRAGAYGKRLLRACGFRVATLATISNAAGALIKGADCGEDWAEAPGAYTDVASILRGIEEKYGFGRKFRQGTDGNWYFDPKRTDITATLSSSPAGHDPNTDSGILKILRPLDWERGGGDVYNMFSVTGAERRDGSVVSAFYADYGSRRPSNSPNVLNYIGRWKMCPPICDPALRTQEDCDNALRSLRELYGETGRRAQFETWFNLALRPGRLVDIDGRICRIIRATGSWAQAEMQLYVREVS